MTNQGIYFRNWANTIEEREATQRAIARGVLRDACVLDRRWEVSDCSYGATAKHKLYAEDHVMLFRQTLEEDSAWAASVRFGELVVFHTASDPEEALKVALAEARADADVPAYIAALEVLPGVSLPEVLEAAGWYAEPWNADGVVAKPDPQRWDQLDGIELIVNFVPTVDGMGVIAWLLFDGRQMQSIPCASTHNALIRLACSPVPMQGAPRCVRELLEQIRASASAGKE